MCRHMLIDNAATWRRNDAIERLGVLERAGDPALTGITRLASYVTGGGAAAVHVLDTVRQTRIAAVGAELGEHPRQDAMCRLVVDAERRIVCADATADPRFGYSSFVAGEDPVRFYASVPLRTSTGAVIGTLCTFDSAARELTPDQVALLEDLAEQVVSQLELRQIARDLGDAASHDALTGAANRFLLADRLTQAIARRIRHGGRTLLAVADVDAFKALNDVHGHDAGDHVLMSVVERLTATLRAVDTVARIGGDEFAVLAEIDDDHDSPRLLAERLQRALARPFAYLESQLMVSISIGWTLAQDGDDMASLLRRADEAMYAGKAHAVVA